VASQGQMRPHWAVLTVWGVVNAVNVLQAAGFLSRVTTGGMAVNHLLGYGVMALAAPALVALVALVRARAGMGHWLGPAAFVTFVAFMVLVEEIAGIEFRSPPRAEILVPYLVLFFGSIVLMGAPMYRLNRRLWLVTALTAALLVGTMGVAMRAGVG